MTNTNFDNTIASKLQAYVPGEQYNNKDWIKLNTNEFPFPPSKKVRKTLKYIAKNYHTLRRYPHPYGEPLRTHIANKLQLKPEEVIISNGSDEILCLICRAFLDQNHNIAYPEITYSLYDILAQAVGANGIAVPMQNKNNIFFRVPLENLNNADAKIIFLPNPNAITGEYIPVNCLLDTIQNSNKLWIIDEAYMGFHTDKNTSCLEHKNILNLKNVIITRTLSKSHGLAGARIGYAVSKNNNIMQTLYKLKDSYNQDSIAIQLGITALKDTNYYAKKCKNIIQERDKLYVRLQLLGFDVIPSHANFLLVTHPRYNAQDIYQALKKNKILVRYFPEALIHNYLRISIGTPRENQSIVNHLMKYLSP